MTLAHSSLLDPSPRLTESQLLEELQQSLYSWVLHNSHSSRVVVRSAVARPCLLPSSECDITDDMASMLSTTKMRLIMSRQDLHHLTVYTEDYPLVLVANLSHAAQMPADVYHLARSTRVETTPINSCKCCRVRALLLKTHETSTSDASDGGPHESGGPNSMTTATVLHGPCATLAFITSHQQVSLSADSLTAFI